MYKLLIIHSHGFHIIEGTAIHCWAEFNTINKNEEGFIAAHLYEPLGKHIQGKFHPVYAEQAEIG